MEIAIVILQVLLLVGAAAICSGLNVAFMSLDLGDLRRKRKLGNNYAKKLYPLRKNAHLTLASILLTNVAAASLTPLVIDSRLNGVLAVIISTLMLTIFSEIMPQAVFARNALLWCGRLHWLIRAMIIVTFPISKPLQILLDKLFKNTAQALHTRHELGLLISEHTGSKQSELDEDEVEIIKGALQLSEKRVSLIMTPMKQVYWLTPQTLLDEKCILEIKATGRSRIPIFNKSRTVCYGVLLVKQLIDFDLDAKPVQIADLVLHPIQAIGSMTALDTMFRKFISARTHLMPVEKDNKIIGIVTIEDLIEEILNHEIEDESDTIRRSQREAKERAKKAATQRTKAKQ